MAFGRLRALASRFGTPTPATAFDDSAPAASDPASISEAQDRTCVRLRGTIGALTVRPRGRTPWLEAELSDGSGRVTLVWMGRLDIPGIDVGRELSVEGRIAAVDGERRIYNPRYQLL